MRRQDHQARRPDGDDRRRPRALGSLSVRNRDHRQRRHQPAPPVGDDGGRARAPDDGAVRPAGAGGRASRRRARSCGRCTARWSRNIRRRIRSRGDFRIDAVRLRDQIIVAGAHGAARAARGVGAGLRDRLLERRQPDPCPLGQAGGRAGDPRGARRSRGGAAADAAGREPAALRRRRAARRRCIARPMVAVLVALRGALLGARARSDGRRDAALGRRRPGACRRGPARVRAAAALAGCGERASGCRAAASASPRAPTAACARSRSCRSPRRSCCSPAPACCSRRCCAAVRRHRLQHAQRARGERADHLVRPQAAGTDRRVLQGSAAPHRARCRASSASPSARSCPGATPARSARASSSRSKGYAKANGEEDPRARFRTISPGFFAALGVPILAGRDFSDADRHDSEQVVIVSQSVARRMFPNQDALNRRLMWTDPVMKFIDVSTDGRAHRRHRRRRRRREHRPGPGAERVSTRSSRKSAAAGCSSTPRPGSVCARSADHADHSRSVGRSAGRAGRRRSTTSRAEVLAPDRLNALVFGGFAGVALIIAVVGVAGVLAFSVSARTREFGIRLAIGSAPHHLLRGAE